MSSKPSEIPKNATLTIQLLSCRKKSRKKSTAKSPDRQISRTISTAKDQAEKAPEKKEGEKLIMEEKSETGDVCRRLSLGISN